MPDDPMAGEETEQAIRVRVTGRVQGVGFRAHAARSARELGLVGRVRNEPDGSVELRARGPRRDLDRLLEAVRTGPPASRVERVEEHPLVDAPAWDAFQVEH